jgi:hypothetical protein
MPPRLAFSSSSPVCSINNSTLSSADVFFLSFHRGATNENVLRFLPSLDLSRDGARRKVSIDWIVSTVETRPSFTNFVMSFLLGLLCLFQLHHRHSITAE